MKVGIYGGTFNPPHKGHSKVLDGVIAALDLDELWMIPTKVPPHKELPQGSPSEEKRFQLVKTMTNYVNFQRKAKNAPKCPVSCLDLEIQREGKSYTVDTLKTLRQEHTEAEFWLIMGEDMLMSFFSWVSPEEVAKMAHICAFLRSDLPPSDALLAQGEKITQELGCQVRLIALPEGVSVSSTQLREGLAENRFSEELLPWTVGGILRDQLYGVDLSLKNLDIGPLRQVVWSFVKAKRMPHILGVEEECMKLAKRWGCDVTLAQRAGVLHDITKYWTMEEHLDFCRAYGFALDPLEESNEKLLHAKSGAVYAREILGEAEEICVAIECHTTAKGNMTVLDKILYLADYIEVNRDFPELEKLRALSYEDLDKAVGYGVEIALEEMVSRNKETHCNTVAAYGQYGPPKGG